MTFFARVSTMCRPLPGAAAGKGAIACGDLNEISGFVSQMNVSPPDGAQLTFVQWGGKSADDEACEQCTDDGFLHAPIINRER